MVMAHRPMKSLVIRDAKKIPTANRRIAAALLGGAEPDPLTRNDADSDSSDKEDGKLRHIGYNNFKIHATEFHKKCSKSSQNFALL